MTSWIDALVLIIGNYRVCYEVIKLRKVEIVNNCSVNELIKLATLCGALNDDKLSIVLFKEALRKNNDRKEKNVILHRLAVVYLKRSKNIDEFYRLSQILIDNIMLSDNSGEITALLDNLVALQLVISSENHDKNLMLARMLLLNAKSMLKDNINKMTDFNIKLSELVRYHSQITINQVQLELEIGNYDLAKKLMLDNFKLVKKYNNEYLSEVLSSLAYIFYKSGDYKNSIHYSSNAIISHSRIGGMSGMVEAKKLLVASLAKTNKVKEAKEVLATISNDPLGINYDYTQFSA